jgi:acyl dehydratase
MSVAFDQSERCAEDCMPGDKLPVIEAPLTRAACALFAGASGDHNPIHIDIDAARDAGLSDVIGHGMYSMAMLARVLTGWATQAAIRQFRVRFQDVTRIGDVVAYSGVVSERTVEGGAATLRVQLQAADAEGRVKTVGEALLRFT